MTTESRAWTVEELLGEGSRLAALFGPKARVTFTVGQSLVSRISANIWITERGSDLKLRHGGTFESVIEQTELYAAEHVMSNRTMTADDLGIAA